MIHWTEAYATGVQQVDDEHKKLIEAINHLETAMNEGHGQDECVRIIGFITQYAHDHFQHEEAIFKRANCPALAENCAAHAALRTQIAKWQTQMKAGVSLSLILEIYRAGSAWLKHHILTTDCKLRGCKQVQP